MKIAAASQLDRLGPIVDRLTDIMIARERGTITELEFHDLRALYRLQFTVAW